MEDENDNIDNIINEIGKGKYGKPKEVKKNQEKIYIIKQKKE